MKIFLCIAMSIGTATCSINGISAKGCGSGHCAHGAGVSNHSAFQAMYELRDSSFTGFIVLKQDTLHGRTSGFSRYDLKFDDGRAVRRISYERIGYMQLSGKAGSLQLAQLHTRSGFFRLLYSGAGVELYDRSLVPHHSIVDVDMTDLLMRHDSFNRYVK